MNATTATTRRLVHDADGLNSAAWPVRVNDAVTTVEAFFTRSHAPVPQIEPTTWRLEVGGLVERPAGFSLEALRTTFPQQQVTATLVCAGLRRNEFLAMGPLPGELPWGPEPASTGRWSGLSLRDLLRFVGVENEARHVEFAGLDRVERHGNEFGFGGSIDLAKAMGEEVLLATGLNERPLPAAHGFPLRAVVPGWIGARSVKWLGRITVLKEPSPNYFQTKAYRLQREINPQDPRDVSGGAELSEIPLNSATLHPTAGQRVAAGRVQVYGWAVGAGGRAVTAVEVSCDGGREWIQARITSKRAAWAWSLWEAALELGCGRHTIIVRALDGTGVAQPPNVEATWNVKGYNNNAWHRVTVDLV